ncbi:hypothetical protein FKW77_007076 [Venturia effusa]|uniref:Uncharacterized protein n=1 Tax=Venturia effusa TaxID=50376 RepID=A0A517LPE3_9PEZI|nr:hypothetical protein FKW77_007076 [Venturia effusa]
MDLTGYKPSEAQTNSALPRKDMSMKTSAIMKSPNPSRTTFLSLPLEIRQAILLEAVAPCVRKALSPKYFIGSLIRRLSDEDRLCYYWQHRRARSSIVSACRTMAAMRAVLTTLKVESDMEWVEEWCLDLLRKYVSRRRFKGRSLLAKDGSEDFVKLSDWVVENEDGDFKIRGYKAVIAWRLVFGAWNSF